MDPRSKPATLYVPAWSAPIVGTKPIERDGSKDFRIFRNVLILLWIANEPFENDADADMIL